MENRFLPPPFMIGPPPHPYIDCTSLLSDYVGGFKVHCGSSGYAGAVLGHH